MEPDTAKTSIKLFNLGPWILAGVALVQVWVIALVRTLVRRLKKPIVDIYESLNIEIGFSYVGPTVGLIGTLRVRNRDVFIKNIHTKVLKAKDGSTRFLNWRAFRPHSISLTPTDPIKLEVVSSFLLTRNNPFKYNVVFVDDTFIADISPKISHITGDWFQFKKTKLQQFAQDDQVRFSSIIENPLITDDPYDQFSKSGAMTDVYTTIDRAYYWEAGDYELEIIVECENPRRTFVKPFRFSLSEQDEKLLRLNTIGILRTLCGFAEQWHFAFPEYRKK